MSDNSIFSRLIAIKKRLDGINPIIVGALLLIFFLSLTLPTYNHTSAGGDMGEYLNNAVRVVHGELPYQDFWLLFPPGEVYLPALLYAVFGVNANIVLASVAIVSALTGLAAYLLGRRIFGDNVLSVISAIFVFYNGLTAPYMLLLLIAAYFVAGFIKTGARNYLIFSGIFTGLGFLFRFHEVGAALAAFAVAIAVYHLLNNHKAGDIFKSLGMMCLCAFALPTIIVLPLLGIWPQMLYQVMIETVMQGSALSLPYFPNYRPYIELTIASLYGSINSGGPGQLKDALFYTSEGLSIYALYLLPLIVTLVSIYYLTRKSSGSSDKVIILMFTLWGLFTFPKVIWRADLAHLAQSITPMFFTLIYMARMGLQREKTARYVSYALVFIVLVILLHDALAIKSTASYILGPQPPYEVSTKYGNLRLWNQTEAMETNGMIAYIDNNTKEGDYIFVTPWESPPLYTLTGRKDPTYYDSLIDPVARPSVEKQEMICRDLLAKDTKLIISYPGWGFDNKTELQFGNACPIVEKCIEDNFTAAAQYGPYIIYSPKAS